VTTNAGNILFQTRVQADAGEARPAATGKFEGSDVYAYVWPTSLDSAISASTMARASSPSR
jgi:hypothetical protein